MLRMRRSLRHDSTIGLSSPDSPNSLCGFVPLINVRTLSTSLGPAGAPCPFARL